MTELDNQAIDDQETEQPLFPVYHLEKGEGIVFLISAASEYEEDAEQAQAVQDMLNEQIYSGPSSLDSDNVIESGNYDLLYADAATLIDQGDFEEGLSTTFCVTSVTVVDKLILVHAAIGLDPDAEDIEYEEEETTPSSEEPDADWS